MDLKEFKKSKSKIKDFNYLLLCILFFKEDIRAFAARDVLLRFLPTIAKETASNP
jgi:hypothetical protein